MIQERKKDYLQRLIEEFFAKFGKILESGQKLDDAERKVLLNDGFRFFFDKFDVLREDDTDVLIRKINSYDLLEQYARLLKLKYELTDFKSRKELLLALSITEYVQKVEHSYSWDRTILREDLLRMIDTLPSENDI